MKKILLAWTLVFGALALMACQPQDLSLDTMNEIFAFEAVSASELLAGAQSDTLVSSLVFEDTTGLDATAGATKYVQTSAPESLLMRDMGLFDKYLYAVQQFLNNSYQLNMNIVASDDPAYANQIQFNLVDMVGVNETYSLYITENTTESPYTQTTTTTTTTTTIPSTTTTTTTTTPPTTTTTTTTTTNTTTTTIDTTAGATKYAYYSPSVVDYGFVFPDTFDTVLTYSFVGKLVVGDTTYYLEGKQVQDGSDTVYVLRSFLDPENVVTVTYRTDSDGIKKYFYDLTVGNELVSSSVVSIDTSSEDVVVSLEYTEGQKTGSYDFTIMTSSTQSDIFVDYSVSDGNQYQESGKLIVVALYNASLGEISFEYYVSIASLLLVDNSQNTTTDPVTDSTAGATTDSTAGATTDPSTDPTTDPSTDPTTDPSDDENDDAYDDAYDDDEDDDHEDDDHEHEDDEEEEDD